MTAPEHSCLVDDSIGYTGDPFRVLEIPTNESNNTTELHSKNGSGSIKNFF